MKIATVDRDLAHSVFTLDIAKQQMQFEVVLQQRGNASVLSGIWLRLSGARSRLSGSAGLGFSFDLVDNCIRTLSQEAVRLLLCSSSAAHLHLVSGCSDN